MPYKLPIAVVAALRTGEIQTVGRGPMAAADLPANWPARFLALSAELTGFSELELAATGVASIYLGFLSQQFDDVTAELIAGWEAIVREVAPGGRADALQARVLSDAKLGPFARNVLALWYTATWTKMPAEWSRQFGDHRDTTEVFGAAYPEGLEWRAGGLHPQGAKPTGYGSWAARPRRVR
jgi:hypothetical protein